MQFKHIQIYSKVKRINKNKESCNIIISQENIHIFIESILSLPPGPALISLLADETEVDRHRLAISFMIKTARGAGLLRIEKKKKEKNSNA